MILDGKKLANKILDGLKEEIEKLPASPAGWPIIKLVVILVGDDSASLSFIKQKQKAAEAVGVKFKLYKFNKNISEQKLVENVKKVTNDKNNTGVIIQLPLPKHIHEQKILNLIPSKKDIDALSSGDNFFEPPAASGIIKLLKQYNIKIKEKKVVIIGKGRLIGKPLAKMIKKLGADLTSCDIRTKNLKSQTLKADILISATGCPGLIKKNMVKQEAVIIDASGDVDFENVKQKARYISPVPGGVGPMTIAILISNLVKSTKLIL